MGFRTETGGILAGKVAWVFSSRAAIRRNSITPRRARIRTIVEEMVPRTANPKIKYANNKLAFLET
jgi:hypothetical protein